MILAFDTETTGLPLFKERSDAPEQPHIIQIAALLVDKDGKEVDRLSTLVQPGPADKVTMAPEAFAAHGITIERANAEGVFPTRMIERFMTMVAQAELIVGHICD